MKRPRTVASKVQRSSFGKNHLPERTGRELKRRFWKKGQYCQSFKGGGDPSMEGACGTSGGVGDNRFAIRRRGWDTQ